MKKLLALSLLLLSGCAANQTAAFSAYGEPVVLKTGESANFDDGLSVTLVTIDDSRCPVDVQCIWAGELRANFVVSDAPEGLYLSETTLPTAYSGNHYFELNTITESSAQITVSELK